jgi:hypothetical protein
MTNPRLSPSGPIISEFQGKDDISNSFISFNPPDRIELLQWAPSVPGGPNNWSGSVAPYGAMRIGEGNGANWEVSQDGKLGYKGKEPILVKYAVSMTLAFSLVLNGDPLPPSMGCYFALDKNNDVIGKTFPFLPLTNRSVNIALPSASSILAPICLEWIITVNPGDILTLASNIFSPTANSVATAQGLTVQIMVTPLT